MPDTGNLTCFGHDFTNRDAISTTWATMSGFRACPVPAPGSPNFIPTPAAWRGPTPAPAPGSGTGGTTGTSCLDVLNKLKAEGITATSGDYTINGVATYCDMTTDGGGWTLYTSIEGHAQTSSWNTKQSSGGVTRGTFNLGFARRAALHALSARPDLWLLLLQYDCCPQ